MYAQWISLAIFLCVKVLLRVTSACKSLQRRPCPPHNSARHDWSRYDGSAGFVLDCFDLNSDWLIWHTSRQLVNKIGQALLVQPEIRNVTNLKSGMVACSFKVKWRVHGLELSLVGCHLAKWLSGPLTPPPPSPLVPNLSQSLHRAYSTQYRDVRRTGKNLSHTHLFLFIPQFDPYFTFIVKLNPSVTSFHSVSQ